MKAFIYSAFLQVLILLSAVETADAQCGGLFSNNGTIRVPTNVTKADKCVYTISRDTKAASNTLLHLTNIILKGKDTLTIYDGNTQDKTSEVAKYDANMAVELQVVVGFQTNTTIVFSQAANNTESSWSIDYNTKECDVKVENLWALRVDSPVYKPTKDKSVSCTYSITNAAAGNRQLVTSFISFEFTGKSNLSLTSGNTSHVYNADSMPDDFFAASKTDPVKIVISIADASTNQNFSLVAESVIADCSGEKVIDGNMSVSFTIPADHPVSYECRWLLRTNLSVVLANVTSLDVMASTDVLAFINGGSSRGSVIASLMADTQNYMVTGSGNALMVTFRLGSNPGARSLAVDFMAADQGGYVPHKASINVEGPIDGNAYYQLVAEAGKVVSVEVTSNVTDNTTLTFHNGLQATDDVLAVVKSSNSDLKTVVGGEKMLMVLSQLEAGGVFNATFSSVKSGCDQLATGLSGQLMYKEMNVNETETCTWTIAPLEPKAGTIILYVDSVQLADTETVTVYTGLKGEATIAKFTDKQMEPVQIYVSAMEKARVVITRAKNYQKNTQVVMRYEVTTKDCGGKIGVPSAGSISTPNYPNFYPLNAQCVWPVGDNTTKTEGKVLFVSFKDIKLAEDHQVQVTGINRTIGYGGMVPGPEKLPADLIVPLDNETNIQLLSTRNTSAAVTGDINQVGGGALLNYWALECGGNFSATNGSFQSPDYPKVPKKALCVWIIDLTKVPTEDNGTNIVRFNLTASNGKTLNKSLTIFDGDSIRADMLPLPLNATTKTANGLLSRYNRLIVLFNNTAASDTGSAFQLKFDTYSCNSSQLCDNGVCMHPDWICNNVDDCGDSSDERRCLWPPATPKPTPTPTPAPKTDYSGYVKAGWVAGCLFIGIILGAFLIVAIPKIVRRLRGGASNYSRMSDDRPVVA